MLSLIRIKSDLDFVCFSVKMSILWGEKGGTLGSDVILNLLNFSGFLIANCARRFQTCPLMMVPINFRQNLDLFKKRTFF